MGYYATIDRMDLRCDCTISEELKRKDHWYLIYLQSEDGWMSVAEDHFTWNRLALISDLLCLQALGVRGTVVVVGEENEWTKYELTDDAVEEYFGEVVYSENPDTRYIQEMDSVRVG